GREAALCPTMRLFALRPTNHPPGASTSPPPFRNNGCSNPCANRRKATEADDCVNHELKLDLPSERHLAGRRAPPDPALCGAVLPALPAGGGGGRAPAGEAGPGRGGPG